MNESKKWKDLEPKEMKDIALQSIDIEKWDALLNKPLPEGAEAAEVYATEGESFSVGLLGGEIDSYELSQASGVSLRADGGQGG